MDPVKRYEGITYIGLQPSKGEKPFPLFNDPETGTTFALHANETMGQAIERITQRAEEARAAHQALETR